MMKCPKCNSDKTVKNGKTPNKRVQKYLCRNCNRNFLETDGTVYFGKHTEYEKIDQIVHAHCEGVGIRATGRIFDLAPYTVRSIIRQAGVQAEKVNKETLQELEPQELQFDEM